MSEDPTPYQHEERAPDTSKKSLGQIAFLEHHMRGFPPFTEEEAHLFWGELEERERQEWEAAAQAVRSHALEEAAKVAESYGTRNGHGGRTGNHIAGDIRALKSSKDGGGND